MRVSLPARLCLLGLPLWAAAAGPAGEPFDARDATIDDVHVALSGGGATCRDVVSAFLARVEALNPAVNAVIALNPRALAEADGLDARLAAGNATGALFCVPVLLKDNFDAVPMSTTGGCLALAASRPAADAPSVRALRAAGAVVLGKANLHEMALEGLTVSSLGGQTLNPFDRARTPGGSSGGTGAAVAAGLAVLGTGTDTVNSLRSPAAANSLFSFRPTRGLISRAGVVPNSYTQDAVGAIARSVKDLAVAMTVLAGVGYDPADNATALAPPDVRGRDYALELGAGGGAGGGLRGVRLGVVEGFFDDAPSAETTPVNEAMSRMLLALRRAGAQVYAVPDAFLNATAIAAELDTQAHEYRELLDAYLSGPALSGPRPASFAELYTEGRGDFLVVPSQYGFLGEAARRSTGDASYLARRRGIQNLTLALHGVFACHGLDALVYPEQKTLPVRVGAPAQTGRNGVLAALTGFPVVVVPAGFSPPSGEEEGSVGVPIGMEILGVPWSEGKLLGIARHISEAVPVRKVPPLADRRVEVPRYEDVPVVVPGRGTIPDAYPVGKLDRRVGDEPHGGEL